MSGGGNVTSCLGFGIWGGGGGGSSSSLLNPAVTWGGISLQRGGRKAAGWGEPEPAQLEDKA